MTKFWRKKLPKRVNLKGSWNVFWQNSTCSRQGLPSVRTLGRKKTFAQFSVLSGRMEVAEDNLGTSDLLEFAIYLPALSLDFLYFFLLNNCISLASFSFRISIFKVPVFSSCPCLRVSICSMVLYPIFVFFLYQRRNSCYFCSSVDLFIT